ncbi:MAG: hypothetical protein DWQ08_05675 [Proteobacteria bacterium]|nr:MAG: hypothetical protein DWQ08_05675 [Pseudomonadota bacterium]
MTKFSETMGAWKLGNPVSFRNLTQFPLLGDVTLQPDYLTLDDAAALDYVRITEVSEGGRVPRLRLENTGPKPVLLLDGEQLVGAKQNRVLNLTVLAPADKTIEIPVSCVEAGRWSYDSPMFMASRHTHFAEGRARKAASVSASMAYGRGRYSDQGEVWQGIEAKASRMLSESPTAAMESVYQRHEASLDHYLSSIAAVDGQAGAVFAIGGRIVGVDLFAHPSTFSRLFHKLLSGYAIDAMEMPGSDRRAGVDAARGFLDQVAGCAPAEYPAVGLGTDLRYHDGGLTVAALVRGEEPVHICAFALDPDRDRQPGGFSRASARARSRRRTV